MSIAHYCEDLIKIFDRCFLASHETRLVRGGSEPIYLPKSDRQKYHELHFAHGFFSSALHEVSHWLIAGEQRRLQEDFGYWYCPDGRNKEQQTLFERVEVKPQAIEWILTRAAGARFQVSLDNLTGCVTNPLPFKQAVHEQVKSYIAFGLPGRANLFRQSLCDFYGTSSTLKASYFTLAEL